MEIDNNINLEEKLTELIKKNLNIHIQSHPVGLRCTRFQVDLTWGKESEFEIICSDYFDVLKG